MPVPLARVVDYSGGRPGANAIKLSGFSGAVRYVGFPQRPKCTDKGELDDFTAHQLGMGLIYEDTATDWRGGFNRGQLAGRQARDHANAIGFPADRPIYMAVDQDVVTSNEFAVMLDYLRGANTTLGGVYVTGVYGEADVISATRAAGVARYFWQTAAWSHGIRDASAHLYQQIGTALVSGVACDTNDVLQLDWGQHNWRNDMEPNTRIDQYYWVPPGAPPVAREAGAAWANAESSSKLAADNSAKILAHVAALEGALTADQAALLAAISDAKTQINLTDTQIIAFLDGVDVHTQRAIRTVLGSLDNPNPVTP